MSDIKEMRIHSAEQIKMTTDLPKVLLEYSKEVIRSSPQDIIKFSRAYFESKLKEQGYFEDHRDKLEVNLNKVELKKTDNV